MTIHEVKQQKYIVQTYANRGLTLISGEGAWLYDERGERYLDMMSNYGVNILGHSHPVLTKRLTEQLGRITTLHGSFNNNVRAEASEALIRQVRTSGLSGLDRIYWSNSGAEAVEAAIKFAISVSGKTKLLSAKNSYHGKSLAALSVTSSGGDKYRKPFAPVLLEVDFFDYGDSSGLRKLLEKGSEYAALILEPVQGEGGIIPASEEFMLEVSNICKESGLLLIVDEIQTGMGRTGTFVNVEQYATAGFSCDMLCLAKGLGGGIPVGATIVTNAVNRAIEKGSQTSTFGGNPLALAGVSATLEVLADGKLLENCRELGDYFAAQLDYLKQQFPEKIAAVRGQGLLIGLELKSDPLPVIKLLQQRKILAAPSSSSVVRFLPPLLIDKEQIDIVISALTEIL